MLFLNRPKRHRLIIIAVWARSALIWKDRHALGCTVYFRQKMALLTLSIRWPSCVFAKRHNVLRFAVLCHFISVAVHIHHCFCLSRRNRLLRRRRHNAIREPVPGGQNSSRCWFLWRLLNGCSRRRPWRVITTYSRPNSDVSKMVRDRRQQQCFLFSYSWLIFWWFRTSGGVPWTLF